MKNTILKSMLAIGIIAFAASMLAVSCGKTAGGGGNNNTANTNTNSGGSGSGGNGGSGGEPTCTGICPSTTLTLSATRPYSKVSGNTVTVNAADLAGDLPPLSDADDNDRGFDDIVVIPNGNPSFSFEISYPGASAVMFFVNRISVSTNNITIPATVTTCQSSESADEALATAVSGSACRAYSATDTDVYFYSYLGTVFNNTKTTSHARGTMRCGAGVGHSDPITGNLATITDTIIFNRNSSTSCAIGVINNGLGSAIEIDDAWVGDTASTSEVELYAIGIDVSGKTIPQFSSDAGYNLAEFIKAQDNAAFKKLLQNNKWGELKFKVKIVKSSDF